MNKFVIWGVGIRGTRLYQNMQGSYIRAFIDNNIEKIGQTYFSLPIIGIEEYKEKYSDCYIIISCINENEIISQLDKEKISKYLLYTESGSEFVKFDTDINYINFLEEYIKEDSKYLIYGHTVLGLYLQNIIERKCLYKPDIIEDFNISEDIDEILIAKDVRNIDEKYKKKYKITDLFDSTYLIKEYYNPLIEKFKNIHTGERCFIVATGPSLNIADLENLKKEYCISVNRIIDCFDKTEWRPQYYMISDQTFLEQSEERLENIDIQNIFLADVSAKYWSKKRPKNHIKFHLSFRGVGDNYLPRFSTDFARSCYPGWTVTYAAIQLAVYMGFKEIYLLGVDCNYLKGSKNNYFLEEKKEDMIDHKEDTMILAYNAAKKYADSHGLKIYNATRGGRLEIFERVDFDSLFNIEI